MSRFGRVCMIVFILFLAFSGCKKKKFGELVYWGESSSKLNGVHWEAIPLVSKSESKPHCLELNLLYVDESDLVRGFVTFYLNQCSEGVYELVNIEDSLRATDPSYVATIFMSTWADDVFGDVYKVPKGSSNYFEVHSFNPKNLKVEATFELTFAIDSIWRSLYPENNGWLPDTVQVTDGYVLTKDID